MSFLAFANKATDNKELMKDFLFARSETLHVKYHLDNGDDAILDVIYYTTDNKELENIKLATLTEGSLELNGQSVKVLTKEEIKLIHDLGFMD